MIQRNLDVTNDPVVEVGNVERPIGSEFHIDGPEPGIVTHQKIRLLEGKQRRAPALERIPVDAAGHDVAGEYVASIFCRKLVGAVMDDARNGSRAMIVIHHGRSEPDTRGQLAEMRIVSSPEQLINRLGMTVGRENVSQGIEGKTERIDLPVGKVLDPGAVEPEAERIA